MIQVAMKIANLLCAVNAADSFLGRHSGLKAGEDRVGFRGQPGGGYPSGPRVLRHGRPQAGEIPAHGQVFAGRRVHQTARPAFLWLEEWA